MMIGIDFRAMPARPAERGPDLEPVGDPDPWPEDLPLPNPDEVNPPLHV